MRPNLINRLKEEWNNLDPVDPLRGLLSDVIDALAEQPAQQALDKKAENARELGLDYEPVWGGGPSNKDYEDAMRLRRLNELAKPAQQQEPVAWRFTGIAGLKRYMTQKQYDAQQPGVKKWYEPFMCANCTSLLAQRKPLTDEEIHQCFLASEQGQDGTEFRKAFARAIEAAHGIKGGSMNIDIRNLQKWLNEEQEAPIDRQALARVLAMVEQPARQRHISYACPQCHWSLEEQPAQRTWVGLTPEQRATIAEANNMLVDDDLFDAIEANLKEKNE